MLEVYANMLKCFFNPKTSTEVMNQREDRGPLYPHFPDYCALC